MTDSHTHAPTSIAGSQVGVILGEGTLARLGDASRTIGARRVLLISDAGVRLAGHVDRAVRTLYAAGLVVKLFDEVTENPTTHVVEAAAKVARTFAPDLIVGLGGGSAMDTAKGVNFILTGGGRMQDYWGAGKATAPMLPMIAVPTTAGTGSEAQSYALITDPDTHQKMACGDKKALPRLAILDPQLTATMPPSVAAATGIDAIAHAVETSASTKRNPTSRCLSRDAWDLLHRSFAPSLGPSATAQIRADMLLGAHLAGCAIENAMLGAAHACANPLTATFGTPHGIAVGLILPHVVAFNSENGDFPYADLAASAGELAATLNALLDAAKLPRRLAELGVREADLPNLAALAAQQWTGSFNPRRVGPEDFQTLYQRAL